MSDVPTWLRQQCGHDSRSVAFCLHCEAADRYESVARIAAAAQAVTKGCEDLGEDFRVPSHLMAALALALDEEQR